MIYINAMNVTQKVYTRVTEGTTMRYVEFNAYILFSDGTKEFLTHSKHKEKLIVKLSELVEFAQLDITDNTLIDDN